MKTQDIVNYFIENPNDTTEITETLPCQLPLCESNANVVYNLIPINVCTPCKTKTQELIITALRLIKIGEITI